jgi:1-acyl-sn-glycerol-3-phosphate acyltransferase
VFKALTQCNPIFNKMPIDSGEGMRLVSSKSELSGQPLKHGEYSQASRAVGLGSYFLSGALAVNASQFLGSPLYLINKDWYNAWMAFTKQSFGLLTMTLTQCWAPTVMKISGDASVRGQLLKTVDGQLVCDFPERLVLIANHQIYTDWLYLWWIAYCNGMHGRLYIILKESLKHIPVLGWGMQFSQFIFLKRNWEKDKPSMAKALQRLNKKANAMWLLLFPEGTNLAPSTRERSSEWAKKTKVKDTEHVLLPRSTGLQFCLQELRGTVDYLYDCTIAYEGVPRGEYAQDIFTLKAAYLEGRPPKSVSMYWRRFKISTIPLDNDKAFDLWLQARWREKDYLLELYHRTGRFPADSGVEKANNGSTHRGAGVIESQVRSTHWYEFLQIFAPMGVLALVLYAFYGSLPKQYRKSIKKQATRTEPATLQSLQTAGTGISEKFSSGLDAILNSKKQEATFKSAAMGLHALATAPQTQALITAFPSDLGSELWKTVVGKEARRTAQNNAKQFRKAQPRQQGNNNDFLTALKNEESRRNAQTTLATIQKAAATAQKGSFWDNLQAEQASRNGSVITQSSGASSTGTFKTVPSTAASSVSGKGSTRTAPSLAAKKTVALAAKPAKLAVAKQIGGLDHQKNLVSSAPSLKLPPSKTKNVSPSPLRQTASTAAASKKQPPKSTLGTKPAAPKLAKTTTPIQPNTKPASAKVTPMKRSQPPKPNPPTPTPKPAGSTVARKKPAKLPVKS